MILFAFLERTCDSNCISCGISGLSENSIFGTEKLVAPTPFKKRRPKFFL